MTGYGSPSVIVSGGESGRTAEQVDGGEAGETLHRKRRLGVLLDRHAVFDLQQQAHPIRIVGIDGDFADLADIDAAIRQRRVRAQARNRLVHVGRVKVELAGRTAGS